MDFSRPLESEESLATRSKIRYLPVDYVAEEIEGDVDVDVDVDAASSSGTPGADADTDGERGGAANAANDSFGHNCYNNAKMSDSDKRTLDVMLIAAANEAATDLLLGPTKDPDPSLVDASLYTERSRPLQAIIRAGDLVVIMESFDKLTFVYAEQGGIYCNRNGHFRHSDFIGKPYGGKVRSHNNRGYGFCYLLKPTPELWARSLNHRTQIVHELDQAQIIFQLFIQPNMTVVESGTGSGAMSHAFMRTIAPHGMLHSFEFNAHRAEAARQEFRNNGVNHLVEVHHKDVCGRVGDGPHAFQGGFDLPGQTVDAVFLDLPEPWLAVPHAAFILSSNGRIASYSPCVEQTQRTCIALKAAGFHSIKTMEYRLQEHYVDEQEYEGPPKEKRPRPEPHNPLAYLPGANASGGGGGAGDSVGQHPAEEDEEDVDTGAEADNEKSEMSEAEAATVDTSATATLQGQGLAGVTTPATTTAGGSTAVLPTNTTTTATNGNSSTKRKKMLVARPFTVMRGHTAFLTFATAGILPQPDPNL
jgi:tRNA (adenine57-N1/adenine58-N1)-methyltransferase